MSLSKGIYRIGHRSVPLSKCMSGVVQTLTVTSPEGWLAGEESVGMSRDRAMKISTVNRCAEVLSNSMGVLPLYIMNEKSKERLEEHRLGRVLWGRANEAMTSFDYNRLMLCNQILRGNAYAWICRDGRTGYPLELIPLPPDYVTIRFDGAGHLWYVFTHPVTGEVTWLRNEDVLHYKAYSEDGIEGISVLRRAAAQASAELALPEDTRLHGRSLTLEADALRLSGRTVDVRAGLLALGGRMLLQGFAVIQTLCRHMGERALRRRGRYAALDEEVRDLAHRAAGRVRSEARSSYRLRAEHADIRATEQVDIDGRHIKVG